MGRPFPVDKVKKELGLLQSIQMTGVLANLQIKIYLLNYRHYIGKLIYIYTI